MILLSDFDVETARVILELWRNLNKTLDRALIKEQPGVEDYYDDRIDPWLEEELERELLMEPGCHCDHEFVYEHACTCGVDINYIDDELCVPDDLKVIGWIIDCYQPYFKKVQFYKSSPASPPQRHFSVKEE